MTVNGLAEFLRTRRAQLTPEDVGLTPFPERRRVAGLRREELAQLAGVSVSYYTRLEQGQALHASEAVLDAMRALPDRQREVLALRYYLDLSEADIAATLGISRGAVKSHASRGAAALRHLLQEDL